MNTNLKAILWAAFVMLTWSRSGGAQAVAKTCIPRAIGVPGLWQQPPNWWSNGRPRLPRFDDPRWQGATRRSARRLPRPATLGHPVLVMGR